jgi:hypothetical protein
MLVWSSFLYNFFFCGKKEDEMFHPYFIYFILFFFLLLFFVVLLKLWLFMAHTWWSHHLYCPDCYGGAGGCTDNLFPTLHSPSSWFIFVWPALLHLLNCQLFRLEQLPNPLIRMEQGGTTESFFFFFHFYFELRCKLRVSRFFFFRVRFLLLQQLLHPA